MARFTLNTTVFTEENVPIAPAAPIMQRGPEPTLSYRFGDRWRDTIAGYRDRRRVTAEIVGDATFVTDWLAGLQHACHTNLEFERKATRTAISLLDNKIVGHRGTVAVITARLPELDQQIDDAASVEIGDAAVSTGEQFESVDQRRARRTRERDAQVGSLRAERQQLSAQRDHALRQIDICLQDRVSHWEQLLVRSATLDAFYNRRARTYARAAIRRVRLPVSATSNLIIPPSWCTSAALPDAT